MKVRTIVILIAYAIVAGLCSLAVTIVIIEAWRYAE